MPSFASPPSFSANIRLVPFVNTVSHNATTRSFGPWLAVPGHPETLKLCHHDVLNCCMWRRLADYVTTPHRPLSRGKFADDRPETLFPGGEDPHFRNGKKKKKRTRREKREKKENKGGRRKKKESRSHRHGSLVAPIDLLQRPCFLSYLFFFSLETHSSGVESGSRSFV